MNRELKDKIEKAKLLSFSQKDIDRQRKYKGKKKKKKKSSSKFIPIEFKKKGTPMKVKDLDDILSGLMNVKP